MPKLTQTLSIVIPAHNEESHLVACLDSIAAQTIKPDAVIVVNNNSSDKTVEVASAYPFVTVLNETQQGIVFTRDKGFNAVTTDLIGRIDADSRLAPNWVEATKQWFNDHPECGAATGDCTFYNFPYPLFQKLHHFSYYTMQRVISGGHILWGSNMAMTRTAWNDVKSLSKHNNKLHEDIELSIHLQNTGHKIMRAKHMLVAVSLRRGDIDPLSMTRYLSHWPNTYFASGRRLHGLFVSLWLFFIWVLMIPASSAYWLKKRLFA